MLRLAVMFALLCLPPLAAASDVVHHRIRLELDPGTGRLAVEDQVTLPGAMLARGPLRVGLNAGFQEIEADGARVEPMRGSNRDHVRELLVQPLNGVSGFTLRYSGTLLLPAAPGDGPGEWLDARGAHLGASSAWYPRIIGASPFTFDLTLSLPAGWRALAPGKEAQAPAGKGARWIAAVAVDALDIVAGPFVERARGEAWGRSMVWLRKADDGLASTYLDAVARYVPFYSALLGAYPFSKFAVVENLRQTGWGMPSFTLLGSRVMRLPFIPHTSLPHEIVHSWWGNGVLVDFRQGNWSEGLTAYLADHLQAQRRGRGARYRRDALARLRAAGTVMAPSDFVSRRDRRSQSAGYDRPMMLFHMLRRARGDAAFIDALRDLFRSGLGRRVGAREVLAKLAPPGEDWFGPWWQRADAPRIALQCCRVTASDGRYGVTGFLSQVQEGPVYALAVPVQILTAGDDLAGEHVVRLAARRSEFHFDLARRPLMLAADAGFDVMRIPELAELPPSLAEALDARDAVALVAPGLSRELDAAYRAMARALGARLVADGVLPDAAGAAWLLGPGLPQTAAWSEAMAHAIGEGTTRVMVVRETSGRALVMIQAASAAAARALAGKLPHYGRYGLLGFSGEGARNVFKGEQPVAVSPMTVVLDAAAADRVLPMAKERALGER